MIVNLSAIVPSTHEAVGPSPPKTAASEPAVRTPKPMPEISEKWVRRR